MPRKTHARVAMTLLSLLLFAGPAFAGSWNGIEPFKSRRADVVRILGQAVSESPDGALRFSVMGGSVLITFVDEKFVTSKKLRPELVGTVLEIVLQHEKSSDTPESLSLIKNRDFDREDVQNASIFRNFKEGIMYIFLEGKLRTTRFTFSTDQIFRARRGGR